MTPAARIQAAIECLDHILDGAPAEQALTRWARQSRFAGSKDRAAVRDHVFDALRARRSLAALGGADTGRGLMLGALRAAGSDPDDVFGAGGHAPAALAPEERSAGAPPGDGAEAVDFPDWLWPELVASHGVAEAQRIARALRERAPVFLRVNLAKSDRNAACLALQRDGISARPHDSAATALVIEEGARRLRQSSAYTDGLVELQDGASQAVVEALPLVPGMRVLDYCAGGGGKALAMAAHPGVDVCAHDISQARLSDLQPRAERAGTPVTLLAATAQLHRHGPFDIVLCDVPCSGSGSWRRAPEAKWRLDEARLRALSDIQFGILEEAAALVNPDGMLAYATCSVLRIENEAVIERFRAAHPEWKIVFQRGWTLQDGTDGFFATHLKRG